MKTMRFFGELNTDFSKNVSFGINGTFSAYTTTFQEEAWNLPAMKLGANLEMRITEKWNAGANLFFVGERMDKQQEITSTTTLSEIQTLSSYFDLNLRLGYKYNNRLDGFLKLNNVANQAYEKWLNYPVQGFQLVLGASYKFDF
jgi:outer membrane receptor protein involved in Fe transport